MTNWNRNLGYYMWLVHRITGILLVVYLFAHILTLSAALRGAEAFNQTLRAFDNPVVRAFELGLVAIVVFHTLNGLRLIALDLFPSWSHEYLAFAVLLISLGVIVISVPFFF